VVVIEVLKALYAKQPFTHTPPKREPASRLENDREKSKA
jgi:hypothetical protein